MSQSYHQQFRANQRNKYQTGLSSTSKFVPTDRVLPARPIAMSKKPSRSDTFTLPTKHHQINPKAPKIDPKPNYTKPQTKIENSPSSIQTKPKNGSIRSVLKQPNSVNQQQNLVRFAKHRNTSSPPPVYNQNPQNDMNRSRRIRIGNDEYIIHQQKQFPTFTYDQEKRPVHVIRDSSSRETNDSYSTDSKPKRRPVIIQKTSPRVEYVYVNETPSTIVPRHHRSKVTHSTNSGPLNYKEKIVYVDDHGNEIPYIYDDEPTYSRRNEKKNVIYYSSPNIIYK